MSDNINAGKSFVKIVTTPLTKNETTGFFAIDGTPFGPGFGLKKINDGYLCATGMTCVTLKYTDEEIKNISFEQNELRDIITTLEEYVKTKNMYNIFGYAVVMFIDWVIYGCSYNLDTPERELIQKISYDQGKKLISEADKAQEQKSDDNSN